MASDEKRSLLDVILASCECGKCSPCAARAELAALRAEVGRLRAAIDNAGNGLIRTLYDQDSVVVDGWACRQLFEAALARKEKT